MKKIALIFIFCLCLLTTLTGLADTAPPYIPEGMLVPQEVKLTTGKKLPVYTGPGEEYARAGNGKAVVSTNDWVQVFGWEGDWLLIQYEINAKQLRFGYIPVKGLLKSGVTVTELPLLWEDSPRVLKESASLTDDPLASRKEITRIPQGTQVKRLGVMSPWAYVEAQDDKNLLRGFVLSSVLTRITARNENQPFDLRAVSWGPLVPDFAIDRYFYDETIGRLKDSRDPAPNVWLRLDTLGNRTNLETLSNFRVVSGRASCGTDLVPLYALDSESDDWLTLHFMPKDGFNRGALEIALDDDDERLENVTIACTRTSQNGQVETITLPLKGVPEDSGYPDGGVKFSAIRFTPFARTSEQMAEYERYSGNPATLGGVLDDTLQPMPELTGQILDLPYDTKDFSLYLLEGRMEKEHGPFGVYDVTFSLENPPEEVWISAYQQSEDSSEIDSFDMIASGVFLPDGLSDIYDDGHGEMPETLERNFAVLLLVDNAGRNDAQIDKLIKDLQVIATFSAEKWNMSYEQHLITTAIGPRSSEELDMQRVTRGAGVLTEIP